MSIEYEIDPWGGVSGYRFGSDRAECRRSASSHFVSGNRGSEIDTFDYFEDLGLFLYFDNEHQKLWAIEICEPARAKYLGKDVLSLTGAECLAYFYSFDNNVLSSSDGIISETLGIGVYVPFLFDDVAASVESVFVKSRLYP